jgi:hypothetical protein
MVDFFFSRVKDYLSRADSALPCLLGGFVNVHCDVRRVLPDESLVEA